MISGYHFTPQTLEQQQLDTYVCGPAAPLCADSVLPLPLLPPARTWQGFVTCQAGSVSGSARSWERRSRLFLALVYSVHLYTPN